MNFALWDEAIAARLSPIRAELSTIPVAALPREAGKFGTENFESIDWLFPSYEASAPDNIDKVQEVTITLVVRLYFQKRYPERQEKDVLEWAESQILGLLSSYRLPDSSKSLVLESGRLFAPAQGHWYKEITFTFRTRLYPLAEVAPEPKVEVIGINDTLGELIVVQEKPSDALPLAN